MNSGKIIKEGIFDNNPILIQFIGMCSTLAVSTSVINGFAMSMAVMFVLVGSNVIVSLIRNVTPDEIRIPIFIVVIATFVTMVEMFLHAYAQPIYEALGIFLPLIVVNCIILGRAEAFASKNTVGASFMDGIGSGLGYTMALLIVSSLREILGAGTFAGISLFGKGFQPIMIFAQPPGAFLILGCLAGLFKFLMTKRARE